MKRLLVLISTVIILAIGYWLLSPFFIDKKVSEESPLISDSSTDLPQQIARGTFVGFDKIHYGSGTASIIKTETGYLVRFEDDFNVANGPDLYVGLGYNGQYKKGSEISELKGNVGSQNYVLPDDFDISTTNEIWIWCKAFSVPFAKAILVQS